MNSIKVNLGNRSYRIVVGYDILPSIGAYITKLNIGRDAYVITNLAIKKKYASPLASALNTCGFHLRFRIIPDSEKSKSVAVFSSIISDIAKFDKKKRTFVIAFGGGVVGDLSGFVASIYKRGIPYIQVPTTLLAQVDSAIGGKTGIDLEEGKNLVGAFYQPRLVFSDVRFLKTLDQRQIRSGLAEVIKYGIIKDKTLFVYLEKNYRDVLRLKPSALEYIVNRCAGIKAEIVEKDEREEKGIRTILNFGHTIGHAIEAAAGYKSYTHGEAVALGMLAASDISCSLGLLDYSLAKRIEKLVKSIGLPLKIKRLSLQGIVNAHYRDKKFIGSRNRFVLSSSIGRTNLVENVPLEVIKQALLKRLS